MLMSWTEEERRRNHEATSQYVRERIDGFLDQQARLGVPFTVDELAAAIDHPKYDRFATQRKLMELKAEGRVHYLAGRWHAGPLPAE